MKALILLAQLYTPEPRLPGETLYDYYTRENNAYQMQQQMQQQQLQLKQQQMQMEDLQRQIDDMAPQSYGCTPGTITNGEACD